MFQACSPSAIKCRQEWNVFFWLHENGVSRLLGIRGTSSLKHWVFEGSSWKHVDLLRRTISLVINIDTDIRKLYKACVRMEKSGGQGAPLSSKQLLHPETGPSYSKLFRPPTSRSVVYVRQLLRLMEHQSVISKGIWNDKQFFEETFT